MRSHCGGTPCDTSPNVGAHGLTGCTNAHAGRSPSVAKKLNPLSDHRLRGIPHSEGSWPHDAREAIAEQVLPSLKGKFRAKSNLHPRSERSPQHRPRTCNEHRGLNLRKAPTPWRAQKAPAKGSHNQGGTTSEDDPRSANGCASSIASLNAAWWPIAPAPSTLTTSALLELRPRHSTMPVLPPRSC